MDLPTLKTEVYTITGRPDRVNETASAIRSATLKAHQSDFYWKDLVEVGLDFGAPSYTQSLDYRSIFPLWRALKYMRKYDPTTTPGTPGKFLDIIVPENVLDRYQVQKQDICYMAGAYLQTNSSTQDEYYLLGYYANPNITDTGYNSWVALDHPYMIIYDAAATVFKSIGKDEEAAAYRALLSEQLAMLQASNIGAVGF